MKKRTGLKKAAIIIACGIVLVFGIIAVRDVYTAVMYPKKHTELIDFYAEKYELPRELVYSVINAESHFNETATSDKGAVGLMQLMPATAKWVAGQAGYSDVENLDLYAPSVNIECGVFYLKYLSDKFADFETVAAAYNAGEGNVAKWLDGDLNSTIKNKDIPFKETKNYVKKINKNLKVYSSKNFLHSKKV